MLARLAASAHNSQSGEDEAAIEKYLRSVMNLENILTLDRLRQVEEGNTETMNKADIKHADKYIQPHIS